MWDDLAMLVRKVLRNATEGGRAALHRGGRPRSLASGARPMHPTAAVRPSRLREMLGARPFARSLSMLPASELLAPSRMLLLQAFDACHPQQSWRQWSSCP